MSVQNALNERSALTSEDLSAKQFYIVQLDANGLIEVAEGALDFIVGVLQNKPESGQAATYRFGGTSKVKLGAGGATVGGLITTDSAGKGILTTTAGNIVIGRALKAGDENDIIEVQLCVQHLFIA